MRARVKKCKHKVQTLRFATAFEFSSAPSATPEFREWVFSASLRLRAFALAKKQLKLGRVGREINGYLDSIYQRHQNMAIEELQMRSTQSQVRV